MRWYLVVGLFLAACGGGKQEQPAPAPVEPPADGAPAVVVTPDDVAPPPKPAPPPFPEGTRSLRLTRTVAVRIGPSRDAKQIGTIAVDTRVGWVQVEAGVGCKKPWVEMVPRGWVCGEFLEPNTRRPIGVELPRLERGEIVPGEYGRIKESGAMAYALPDKKAKKDKKGDKKAKKDKKDKKEEPPDAGVASGGEGFGTGGGPVARPDQLGPDGGVPVVVEEDEPRRVDDPMEPSRPLLGAVTVRKYGEVAFGDKVYWKISRGNEYVPLKSIRIHEPSAYQGVRLGDDTGLSLPMAFVWPKQKDAKHVWVRKNAQGRGALRQVAARTPFAILETAEVNGKPTAYRIGEGEWLEASQVRVAQPAPPPPKIGEHERWFDIDLDTQILVAYEGTTAVYTTMISSGKKDTPTSTGVWRMWKKLTETDMNGLSGEDPYSVSTVPWTQFFDPDRDLALHASYWHDRFGTPRSHGCVNLSPADARWLYFWSEPRVPPGWTMTAGVVELPGSIVRVRSNADPDPPFKGYAIKVQAAR